jgi:hypothetical protein
MPQPYKKVIKKRIKNKKSDGSRNNTIFVAFRSLLTTISRYAPGSADFTARASGSPVCRANISLPPLLQDAES